MLLVTAVSVLFLSSELFSALRAPMFSHGGVEALSLFPHASPHAGSAGSEEAHAGPEGFSDGGAAISPSAADGESLPQSLSFSEASPADESETSDEGKSSSEADQSKQEGQDAPLSQSTETTTNKHAATPPTAAVSGATESVSASPDQPSSAAKKTATSDSSKQSDSGNAPLAEVVVDEMDQLNSVNAAGVFIRRIWKEHKRVGEDLRDALREYLVALEKEMYTQQAEIFGLEKLKMEEAIHREKTPEARKKEAELELRALAEHQKFMRVLFSRLRLIPEKTKTTEVIVNRIEELDEPVDLVGATDKGSGADVLHSLKVLGEDLKSMRKSLKKFADELDALASVGSAGVPGELNRASQALGVVGDPLAGPVSSLGQEALSLLTDDKGNLLADVDSRYHEMMDQDFDAFPFDEDVDDVDAHGLWNTKQGSRRTESDGPGGKLADKKGKRVRFASSSFHSERDRGHNLDIPWAPEASHHRHSARSSSSHRGPEGLLSFYSAPEVDAEDGNDDENEEQSSDDVAFPGFFFLELGSKRTVGSRIESSASEKPRAFIQQSQQKTIRPHSRGDAGGSVMDGEQPLSFLQTNESSDDDDEAEFEERGLGGAEDSNGEGKESGEEDQESAEAHKETPAAKAEESEQTDKEEGSTSDQGEHPHAGAAGKKEEKADEDSQEKDDSGEHKPEKKNGEEGNGSEGQKCVDIVDPKQCTETANCFHDDVYQQCFFNCTIILKADKCNEHENCRYEQLLPKNACVNQGYQSVSLTKQSFEGIMRGCEEFRDKKSCDMMEKATQRLKDAGKSIVYDCHWLSADSEGSEDENDSAGASKDAEGGRSVCINRLEAPTAEKLLWGTIIAERERKLKDLETNRHLTPDKVCVRPRELTHATLAPDKPFYAVGDQVEVECNAGSSFVGTRRTITCHNEGAFDPQVACIPKRSLSSQQQLYMRKIGDYADVEQDAAGMSATSVETASGSAPFVARGIVTVFSVAAFSATVPAA
ncbi:rhoptry neck protein RON1 [Besnoitia besnoiti]|uniref:Rhoptry neck protein RON1 n=1 Tax=Besnoitia besnoiti TaxID=94643 RepID=A0A2A9M7M2_BESBE|nr:rhoptry neck protein RON1 [Besnoitia besnoiti]PFH33995.1 rhoptry neck protein RON1 [Besnoitia besnoiti]